jgi:hypothetical protein
MGMGMGGGWFAWLAHATVLRTSSKKILMMLYLCNSAKVGIASA